MELSKRHPYNYDSFSTKLFLNVLCGDHFECDGNCDGFFEILNFIL